MDFTPKQELTYEEKMSQLEHYNDDDNICSSKLRNLLTFNMERQMNSNTFMDLELFEGYNDRNGDSTNNPNKDANKPKVAVEPLVVKHIVDSSIFNKINKTNTLYGRVKMEELLVKSTTNIYKLEERQTFVKKLMKVNGDGKMSKLLKKVKGNEQKIMWFWNDRDDNINSLYEMVYFDIPYLSQLNSNATFLQLTNMYKIILSPLVSAMTPITCIIIPFIIAKIFKRNVPFVDFLSQIQGVVQKMGIAGGGKMSYMSIAIWVMMYLQNAYNTCMTAKNTHKIINILHKKIKIVSEVVECCNELNNMCDKDNGGELLTNVSSELIFFNKLFNAKEFRDGCNPSLLSNKGEILSAYYVFLENKELLLPILNRIGELDSYLAIGSLVQHNGYSFTKWNTKSKKPVVKFTGIKHPYFDDDKYVSNDVSCKTNMLITGPNAAGKSTFIKSVALNLILSQTLGICYATSGRITPFETIRTYLQIKDTKGKESLFEAQMNRCEEYFQMVKAMDKSKFAFIAMDEIFTSTNSKEGFQAAEMIIKKLTSFKNNRSIIATHFTDLSKLAKKKSNIKNYKFDFSRNNSGDIEYSYKLGHGVSEVGIAMELLSKKEAFGGG